MSALVFGSLPPDSRVRVVEVPGDLASRDQLFSALERGLTFPSYWGRNWDALLDMLRDLTWLPDEEVRVIHDRVPADTSWGWSTYLDVVADAVADRHAAIEDGFR